MLLQFVSEIEHLVEQDHDRYPGEGGGQDVEEEEDGGHVVAFLWWGGGVVTVS
jgi:hypothetical protein